MNTDLIPRDTLEDIVRCRDEALALYEEASSLIAKANELMKRATSSSTHSFRFSINRHTLERIGDERFVREARREIDKHVWRHIFNATGLGDLFDSRRRKQFEETLEAERKYVNGEWVTTEPPEVTVDNVMATALQLAGSAGDIFNDSVHDLFTALKSRFKSHSGFGFGSRIIFAGILDWGYFGTWAEQQIWDLERVVYMLDGKSPPERYGGILGEVKQFRRENDMPDRGEIENDYFKVKWYKNGNVHIWLLREDLTEKMNVILRDERSLGRGPA